MSIKARGENSGDIDAGDTGSDARGANRFGDVNGE